MNVGRVAALLRELADELERDNTETRAANDQRPAAPKPRRRRRPVVVAPSGVSDVDIKRAVDAARRRGIMVGR